MAHCGIVVLGGVRGTVPARAGVIHLREAIRRSPAERAARAERTNVVCDLCDRGGSGFTLDHGAGYAGGNSRWTGTSAPLSGRVVARCHDNYRCVAAPTLES